jgi:spermidine synthase
MPRLSHSTALKAAVFATGLSGIVSEYVLATLATYFLGNQLVQWTLTISIMLFAMGLGSRLSRHIHANLLVSFISIEAALSLLVGLSALAVYAIAGLGPTATTLAIYGLSIAIGILIGLEIPLVTRINNGYETLRTNISSIMEKDYYGALLGGIFFAFVGLPFLGFSYTPIVLGAVNLMVAILVIWHLWALFPAHKPKPLTILLGLVGAVLSMAAWWSKDLVQWADQNRYTDKVIFNTQSAYQKITITQYKDNYWLYINDNQQLSTLDEHMYHEPLVHPALLTGPAQHVLIIGGGDGCAVREILKYSEIEKITLVDLDPVMTNLAREHPVLLDLNDSALHHEKVMVVHEDGKKFLELDGDYYDVIIVDLPDPKTVDLAILYTVEFYRLAHRRLRPHGRLITQAGSPYYATRAFYCIEKSMKKAGFYTLPLHNQVLTMGQWGWVLGSKNDPAHTLVQRMAHGLGHRHLALRWLTAGAVGHITSFGQPLADTNNIELNTLGNPILYRYYNQGNWDVY